MSELEYVAAQLVTTSHWCKIHLTPIRNSRLGGGQKTKKRFLTRRHSWARIIHTVRLLLSAGTIWTTLSQCRGWCTILPAKGKQLVFGTPELSFRENLKIELW